MNIEVVGVYDTEEPAVGAVNAATAADPTKDYHVAEFVDLERGDPDGPEDNMETVWLGTQGSSSLFQRVKAGVRPPHLQPSLMAPVHPCMSKDE